MREVRRKGKEIEDNWKKIKKENESENKEVEEKKKIEENELREWIIGKGNINRNEGRKRRKYKTGWKDMKKKRSWNVSLYED